MPAAVNMADAEPDRSKAIPYNSESFVNRRINFLAAGNFNDLSQELVNIDP